MTDKVQVSVVVVTQVIATVGTVATASRMLWAFAREGGLPYSEYVARVSCFNSRCLTSVPCLHILGRSTHAPPTIRDWNNNNNQPTTGLDQHRIICGIRRIHFVVCRQLLLLIHPFRLRDAEQTPHNSRFRLTLGTVQAWTCRCSNHCGGNSLLRTWRVLFHVAYDGETNRGEHELLRTHVRRRDDF